MKYDVFISYSRKDIEEVKRFIEYMKQRIPSLTYWFDITGIESGDEFDDRIVSAIDNSAYLIFFISDNSIASRYVKKEVMYANNTKKKILPILLKDAQLKKWVLFDFGRIDCINSTDNNQVEKILKNLSNWTDKELLDGNTSQKERIPSREPERDVVAEKPINREYKIVQANGIKFKMIKVDGGRFDMGAENSAYDESPVHNVTLSDYYMAETPVTQELWNTVMGNNPSYFKNKDFPVEEVSWVNCIEFIKKLNSITGKELRLPTEAEWEYAARGGKYAKGCIYSGSNDINQVAWWAGNSENTTHMVKTKLPNELGIYDMSGNVWEWCNDNSAPYSNESVTNPQGPSKESSKVQRGGCWDGHLFANKDSCKVTYRSSDSKIYSSKRIGLRLAMSASNMPVPKETKILPNIFKLTIADKDIHMLLSANKEYYIGNILDKNAKFNWLKENSKISAKDAMIAGATITGLTVTPILTLCAALLYWLFKPDKDKKNDEVIIDENFCNAISGDYKFSIPNADELKDVIESEKSHCFVLRLGENPQLNEVLSK